MALAFAAPTRADTALTPCEEYSARKLGCPYGVAARNAVSCAAPRVLESCIGEDATISSASKLPLPTRSDACSTDVSPGLVEHADASKVTVPIPVASARLTPS